MASAAQRAKAEAAALGDELKNAKAALSSFQALAEKGAAGDAFNTATAKAKADVVDLTNKLRELKKVQDDASARAKDRPTPNFVKWVQEAGKSIKDGLGTLKSAASGDADAIKTALGAGGIALEKGATLAAQSAVAIGVAAAGLVAGAVKMGVESTAAADKQRRALGYLTRGYGEASGAGRGVVQGDLAYRVTLSLAGEKGIEPSKALERMRGLIDSKFDRAHSELLFKVSADLGEVKGESKAEEFLGQLEALKRLDSKLKDARDRKYFKALELERGGAQASALDKFAESGIKSSEVLGKLALKGESLQQVSLRLRRGKIDADAFARAVAEVGGKDVTGAAGKGLDATINRIKIGITSLFEGWDLTPIDELGRKLDGALKSEGAQALKKGIAEVGAAVLGLTGDVSEADISAFFSKAAEAAHDLVPYIKASYEVAKDLIDLLKAADAIGLFEPVKAGFKAFDALAKSGLPDKGEEAGKPAAKGAEEAGKAFDDGLAKGINDNAGVIEEAARKAAGGADTAAREKLGIKSPARAGIEAGKFYDQGWEQGIDQNAGRVAAAAGRMAGGVGQAGAASGEAGTLGGGGAGGIVVNAPYSPVINVGAGASADAVAAAKTALADDYAARFLPNLRLAMRDARELALR